MIEFGVAPTEFWAMTPREVALLTGYHLGKRRTPLPDAEIIEDLMQRFPDQTHG